MKRRAMMLGLFVAGCGSTSRGPDPAQEFRPRAPEAAEIKEILKGWDVLLCALQPAELILAEQAYEFRARKDGIEVPESEIPTRVAKKVEEAKRRITERNAKKGKSDTLTTYLQAVNASEEAFREIARREARVEALATRVLQIDDKNRRAPPGPQEVQFAIYRTVERSWKQLGASR